MGALNRYFLHIVADYGVGDPAFGEVIQKLKFLNPQLDIYPTAVPAFSTLSTGFWIAQYSLQNVSENLAIYSNTAPRDLDGFRVQNEGERFLYALLKNRVKVVAVNAGYVFSFVKQHISSLYEVNTANKGSQFRSRDFYPEAVVGILRGEEKYIGKQYNVSFLPDVPKNRIAFIDGYGNIKTTVRESEISLKVGTKVSLTINGVTCTAIFAEGIFGVEKGELAFSPGSSGGKDKFLEISLRSGSAWDTFHRPKVENEFQYEPFQ